eukprot:gene24115-30423_t
MGAGKGHTVSWLNQTGLFPLEAFVNVDPDAIRLLLPETDEYNNRDAMTCGHLTQKEVGYISEILTYVALKKGKNVLVDGSLRDARWYLKYFRDLRSKFPILKVAIINITAKIDTVLSRARKRALVTGRIVPEKVILDTMSKIPESIEILSNIADFVATFNNEDTFPEPLLYMCNMKNRACDKVLWKLSYRCSINDQADSVCSLHHIRHSGETADNSPSDSPRDSLTTSVSASSRDAQHEQQGGGVLVESGAENGDSCTITKPLCVQSLQCAGGVCSNGHSHSHRLETIHPANYCSNKCHETSSANSGNNILHTNSSESHATSTESIDQIDHEHITLHVENHSEKNLEYSNDKALRQSVKRGMYGCSNDSHNNSSKSLNTSFSHEYPRIDDGCMHSNITKDIYSDLNHASESITTCYFSQACFLNGARKNSDKSYISGVDKNDTSGTSATINNTSNNTISNDNDDNTFDVSSSTDLATTTRHRHTTVDSHYLSSDTSTPSIEVSTASDRYLYIDYEVSETMIISCWKDIFREVWTMNCALPNRNSRALSTDSSWSVGNTEFYSPLQQSPVKGSEQSLLERPRSWTTSESSGTSNTLDSEDSDFRDAEQNVDELNSSCTRVSGICFERSSSV